MSISRTLHWNEIPRTTRLFDGPAAVWYWSEAALDGHGPSVWDFLG